MGEGATPLFPGVIPATQHIYIRCSLFFSILLNNDPYLPEKSSKGVRNNEFCYNINLYMRILSVNYITILTKGKEKYNKVNS